jgi:LmbE family N-acetylglucosaminyl deacetylase
MKILYIFPHPDDESFGPASVMHRQLQYGDEVYLLTLTKGGATKQRFRLGLSIEEMGEVRLNEMKKVALTLGLCRMDVWDFPDGDLKEMDPRILEAAIKKYVSAVKPDILVTYPVHGISGFHDHLVTHAVVKRLYLEMKEEGASYLKRLAFLTLPDSEEPIFVDNHFRLKHSQLEQIDCVIQLAQDNIEMLQKCLACYETYQSTIEESRVIEKIGDKVYFEFYGEDMKPVVDDIKSGLD